MNWQAEVKRAAADKVRAMVAKPLTREEYPDEGEFDPWELFPMFYGTYSSQFDDCVISVLEDLAHRTYNAEGLGADMLKEVLCTSNLCDYGSSPRVCFPTPEFAALLPQLLEKWKAYAEHMWRT